VLVHPLIFCKITQSDGNIESNPLIMPHNEKTVAYTTENSYLTQNTISASTKNVWLVFHGIGYLSRYFVKYFNSLDPETNYIIVPQAPSKYYLGNEYKYVGASWLTKENTRMEIGNVLNYIDAVLEAENLPKDLNFVLFGFSQGGFHRHTLAGP
jgi:predicted esterase